MHSLILLIKFLMQLMTPNTLLEYLLTFLRHTIDHQILLHKLSFYGIRGIPLEWFRSYLSNRSQYCSINGINSSSGILTYGVPQESILRPLLVILYVNDFENSSSVLSFVLFADDSN